MALLPQLEDDSQPLRTVGELRQFIAGLDDSMLLTSYGQYGDEERFPIVAEVQAGDPDVVLYLTEDAEEQGHWLDHKRLHLFGYEQYEGDPDLEESWRDIEPEDNLDEPERHYTPAYYGPGQEGYGAPILSFIERDSNGYWYGEYSVPEEDADWSESPGVVYSSYKRLRIEPRFYKYLLDLEIARSNKTK